MNVLRRWTCNPQVPGSNPFPVYLQGFVFGGPEFKSSKFCNWQTGKDPGS